MAKKKQKKRRTAAKKKSTVATPKVGREPEYMVQISDPKAMRKEILETLRETIIFMQGYEGFRKLQDEKLATFTLLKAQVKELDTLINHRLRRMLPKGKLLVRTPPEKHEEEHEDKHPVKVVSVKPTKVVETPPEPQDELADLERQLRDIEGQLKGV
jgi:hypothetical protein